MPRLTALRMIAGSGFFVLSCSLIYAVISFLLGKFSCKMSHVVRKGTPSEDVWDRIKLGARYNLTLAVESFSLQNWRPLLGSTALILLRKFIGFIVIVVIGFSLFYYTFCYTELFGGVYYERGRTNQRMIALTFDDGPSLAYTPKILDLLDKYNAKATFFVLGKAARAHPQIIRLIHRKGHEIGNHSYSHKVLILNKSMIEHEIALCDEVIINGGAPRPKSLRPPYGTQFVLLPFIANRQNKRIVTWSIYPRDIELQRIDDVVLKVINSAQNGDIVLLHDSLQSQHIVTIVGSILETLSARGYRFVTVSTILGK